jgi:cytochrome c553
MKQRAAGIIAALAALGTMTAAAVADPAAGRKKAQMCAACHGLDGVAKIPEAPNLAGESVIYIDRQLKAFRSGERKHPQMSIIAQGLSDEDIRNVADWYSSIKSTGERPQERVRVSFASSGAAKGELKGAREGHEQA